jgi:hypothetical protein
MSLSIAERLVCSDDFQRGTDTCRTISCVPRARSARHSKSGVACSNCAICLPVPRVSSLILTLVDCNGCKCARYDATVRELLQHRVPRPPLHAHSKSDDQQCSLHELPGLPAYNSRSPSPWTSSKTRAGGNLGPVVLVDDDLKWPSRPRINVIIDILPHAPVVPKPANFGAPISLQPSPLPPPFASPLPASDSVFFPSPQPRPLSVIDPAVTLSSPSCLQATSLFSVVSREGHVVHRGMSTLDLVCTQPPSTSSGQGGNLLYRTELVPTYWKEICNSQGALSPSRVCPVYDLTPFWCYAGSSPTLGQTDPTQFTIFHDVVPCPELAASCSTGVSLGQPPSIFSAVYEFRYPHLAPMGHLPQAQGYSQPQSQQVHAIPNIAIDNPCPAASLSSSFGVPVTHSAHPVTPQQVASPQFDSVSHGLVSEARSLPARHHLHPRLDQDQGGELELAIGQAHNPPWLGLHSLTTVELWVPSVPHSISCRLHQDSGLKCIL